MAPGVSKTKNKSNFADYLSQVKELKEAQAVFQKFMQDQLRKESESREDICHTFAGGGISRFKNHLAGVSGNIRAFPKAPLDVRAAMLKNLSETSKKNQTLAAQKRSFSEMTREGSSSEPHYLDDTPGSNEDTTPIHSPNPCPRPGGSLLQPNIKSALRGKDAALRTDRAIARFWTYVHYHILIDLQKVLRRYYNIFVQPWALLHWLRERASWKEIVRPGATRFATTFLTLDSIVHQQVDLECLMVDESFRESAFDMWMYETTSDLDIDSLEEAFQGEDDYSSVDFGLGVGGAAHEDINTIGLP
ncbi:hypothetical protein LINPERPRIM_LOCUS653 [Linum perenne]